MANVGSKELVTQKDVSGFLLKSDAEGVLTDRVFDGNGDFSQKGVEFITAASEKVKNYLNRNIIVEEYNPLLASNDWKFVNRTPDKKYPFQLRLNRVKEWPVLSVDESVRLHGERKIFAKDDSFKTIEYFAGFRRSDQDLTDLPSSVESEFGNKSEIPVIPQIILDVTKRITVHRALRNLKGLIGIKTIEQKFGDFSGMAQIEDAKETYESKQLSRINAHRFLT